MTTETKQVRISVTPWKLEAHDALVAALRNSLAFVRDGQLVAHRLIDGNGNRLIERHIVADEIRAALKVVGVEE